MIVECENCHTRFRLDEARVPATGAKVRCSRCKTAFIVKRPDTSRGDVIDEVVAEATNPGQTRSPDVTQDLFDTSVPQPSADSAREGGDEEKWEFDEEPQGAQASAPLTSAAPAATTEKPKATQAPGDDEDLDSLGSPSEWNLLGAAGTAPGGGAGGAAGGEAGAASRAPLNDLDASPRSSGRAVPSEDSTRWIEGLAARAADVAENEPAKPRVSDRLHEATAQAIAGAAWLAASALCAVGLMLALTPRTHESAPAARSMSATLEAAKVQVAVRKVESAVAGGLVVVRGELPAGTLRTAERLRATWVDESGKPIGTSAFASPPHDLHALRERSPERLFAEGSRFLGGAFEVVFDELPAAATAISFKREVAPQLPPMANRAVAGEESGRPITSSRPSLPLSSE